MHNSQIEILLNEIYENASLINDSLALGRNADFERLLKIKKTNLKILERDKHFLCSDTITLFDVMLSKIIDREIENLKLLKTQKSKYYIKYKNYLKTSKILNKHRKISERIS